jgi:hypothetical protein
MDCDPELFRHQWFGDKAARAAQHGLARHCHAALVNHHHRDCIGHRGSQLPDYRWRRHIAQVVIN